MSYDGDVMLADCGAVNPLTGDQCSMPPHRMSWSSGLREYLTRVDSRPSSARLPALCWLPSPLRVVRGHESGRDSRPDRVVVLAEVAGLHARNERRGRGHSNLHPLSDEQKASIAGDPS